MTYRYILFRASLLASTAFSFSVISSNVEAQVILDQYLQPGIANTAPEYYRGGGNILPPINTNARDTATGVTVLTRPHPDYDPLGKRLGSILFNASLSESFGYDSNPLGIANPKGSSLLLTQGTFSAATDWNRHGLNIQGVVNDYRYFDVPKVSHTDYIISTGGYLDIGRDRLNVNYTHSNLNILPTSLDNLGGNQSTQFTIDQIDASYTAKFNRVSVIPQVQYSIYRFGNNGNDFSVGTGLLGANGFQTPNSVSLVNNGLGSVNNHDVVTGGVTVKYELSPGRDIVVIVRASNAHYTSSALSQLSRDYNNIQFLAGIDFQATAKLRYRVLAGYERRSYNNNAFKPRTSPVFEGQVIWNMTQLTTVTVTGSRRIEDSVTAGLNNFTYTTGRVQIDHELKRNVILTAFGQIQRAEYSGNQNATIYNAGAKATWRLNRRMALVGSYEYVHRESKTFNKYDEHLLLAQIKFSL